MVEEAVNRYNRNAMIEKTINEYNQKPTTKDKISLMYTMELSEDKKDIIIKAKYDKHTIEEVAKINRNGDVSYVDYEYIKFMPNIVDKIEMAADIIKNPNKTFPVTMNDIVNYFDIDTKNNNYSKEIHLEKIHLLSNVIEANGKPYSLFSYESPDGIVICDRFEALNNNTHNRFEKAENNFKKLALVHKATGIIKYYVKTLPKRNNRKN